MAKLRTNALRLTLTMDDTMSKLAGTVRHVNLLTWNGMILSRFRMRLTLNFLGSILQDDFENVIVQPVPHLL